MEKKISLYILLPEYHKRFNYLVPQTMLTETVIKLVCKSLKKLGFSVKEPSLCRLISTSNGMVLPASKSMYEAGVTDGNELILLGGYYG